MKRTTFGSQVIAFHRALNPPDLAHLEVEVLNPLRDRRVQLAFETFYQRYFADQEKRVYILGINPGRLGSGTTGVPFTDPVALDKQCGIAHDLVGRRELSAQFMETLIGRMGGPEWFYQMFFVSAICPIGLARRGRNYNYYDDRRVENMLRPFIAETLRRQLDFGAYRRVAIVLGTGRNFQFLRQLNAEYHFFDELVALEHPRFVMQYKRNELASFLRKYERTLRRAEEAAILGTRGT